MSFKLRHEGSPQHVENLSVTQVVEGLQDGQWEPTDEVMGPSDRDWQAIEQHPQFAEIAEEIEPPPPRHPEDETRLDMTPLIDVCLVLLIFFILTLTYTALERMLDSPKPTTTGVGQIDPGTVKAKMIRVQVKQMGDRAVLTLQVGDTTKPDVPLDKLEETVRSIPEFKGRNAMLIDYDREVQHGTIVGIQDTAKALGLEQVYFVAHKR